MTRTAINNLHKRWGLSSADIARALHTSPTVIRHWRNSVEPNSDEVARAYWTSFKTVEAADGGLSVVGKSYDDVAGQVHA